MRRTSCSTLFPYTTLFRSRLVANGRHRERDGHETSVLPSAKCLEMCDGFAGPDAPEDFVLLGLRSEEHTSELQSQSNLVCRLLLEKKKQKTLLTSLPQDRS